MPEGMGYAYAFSVTNAMNFTIVAGTPVYLYFNSLGASATILGIIAALASLNNLLQIPAASFVERYGYRRFVLMGWSWRPVFVFFITIVVLLPRSIDHATKMCLILFLLLCYQVSRGISVCGFLPWFTQLVPEKVRGQYLSTDQFCVNVTTLVIMGFSMIYLQYFHEPRDFAVLFAVSFLSGVTSIQFLKRIPDVPVVKESKSGEPVPWRAMLTFRPFRKVLIFNLLVQSALAAQGVFYIKFLKDLHHVSDPYLMGLNVIAASACILALYYFRKILDRVGNRPFLFVSCVILAVDFLAWGLVAGGFLPLNWWVMAPVQILGGVALALYGTANVRLSMHVIPHMGRSHFFALLSAASSLTTGIFPVLWGSVIDSFRMSHFAFAGIQWNIYFIMYLILVATMVISVTYVSRLEDKPGMTTEQFLEELFVHTPTRALSRIITRRPSFWNRYG